MPKATRTPKGPSASACPPNPAPPAALPPPTPALYWAPALLDSYEANAEEYDALIATNQAAALEQRAAAVLDPSSYPLPTRSGGSLLPWVYSTFGRSPNPRLAAALAARKALKSATRHAARDLAHNLFIYKSPARYAILMGFAHLGVERAAEEYPPRNHWVASSPELYAVWEPYLRHYEQPDKRLARHPTILLDAAKIKMSIPETLSCCLYDKETNQLVFVVIRKFANHRAILDWAKRLVHRGVTTCKSIRLEDPGSLIQVMFSAGSRSAPSFGIVRNVTASLSEGERGCDRRAVASLFSYVWLRAKGLFPSEIIADFEEFYDKYSIPRFDPEWPHSATSEGAVELPCGLGPISFSDVERSPGLGVLHDRYARAVHREIQGHKWALSWMSNRWGRRMVGGHFYLCGYAVECQACEDSAWSWCPHEWHCTGLSNFEPTFDIPEIFDEIHNQCGVAFVSSARVPGVYQKWLAASGVSGKEKVARALAELDSPSPSDNIYI